MSYLTIKLGNRIPFSNQTNNPTSVGLFAFALRNTPSTLLFQIRTNYQILGVNVARRLVVALANLKKTMGIRVNTPKLLGNNTTTVRLLCCLIFPLTLSSLSFDPPSMWISLPFEQTTSDTHRKTTV